MKKMKHLMKFFSILLLCLSAVVLIALRMHLVGWGLLAVGFATLLFCQRHFAKDIFLAYFSIGILGVTPINTDIGYAHLTQMSIPLLLAIFTPYSVSRYVYKDYLIKFKFHHGRKWYKTEVLYIVITAILAYLMLPFLLSNTGSYQNWDVRPGPVNLIVLFLGTQLLGLWDELFFISTILGILRRHINFYWANIAQATLMTSFLYELGFKGWAFVVIFVFSFAQGYIFKKTESLFYVITIHLTLDLVLYLVLIHAHYPEWMPIFLLQ